jgi:hypothetical protein
MEGGEVVDAGVFLILNRGASLAENLRLAKEAGFDCVDRTCELLRASAAYVKRHREGVAA